MHSNIKELENLLSTRSHYKELEQYGTINLHLGRRSFYGGSLDKRRSIPILRRSPPDVAHFLQKVPKYGDYLKRENHSHFGIHYHYLNARKERSDTVLCFKPPQALAFIRGKARRKVRALSSQTASLV
jgi:hypothetical protein